VPIFFVDTGPPVIGAAHAGWRGTALGIAARMVETFAERFSSRPENILAVIGPAIGPCCYQVDTPVFDLFCARPAPENSLRPCPEITDAGCLISPLSSPPQIREVGSAIGTTFTLRCLYGVPTPKSLLLRTRRRKRRAGRQDQPADAPAGG